TAFNMALHSPSGSRIITVDLPAEMRAGKPCGYGTDEPYVRPAGEVGAFFRGTEMEGKITQAMADITDSSQHPLVDFALDGRKADLAFIDASHDYESVKVVFERLVLPRMQEGGLVIFDDYMRAATHPGVTHFLLRKAHDEGYVFYSYLPLKEPQTNLVLFLNLPESRGYGWRSA
ncbi:MAG: class I SAM-dependent methyltransferase, partial [Candidatus Micrarchaeota archaeon]|nr:class I SAM-dependent methyltransferase [Candidatus Micrarchaeota archaeon]